jgi:uncharacterized protein (TIGR03083 family)
MGLTEGSEPMSDAELRELLAARALHASVPSEDLKIDAFVARDPAAAAELARLETAAAWIGATEALTPPPALRASVLAAARARSRATAVTTDELTRIYLRETRAFGALVPTLAAADLAARTANGLSVRDLVIHLAAMETMVAEGLGHGASILDAGTDVEGRTATFVEAFALQPIDAVLAIWREAITGVTEWAATGTPTGLLPWLGIEVRRDTLLVSRTFETWIHANDIRRAVGRSLEHPPAAQLHRMADFSMRNLPAWLDVVGRGHPGRTARVVLTGPGGGSWLVPLTSDGSRAVEAADVVLELDLIDWCHRVGERVSTEAIAVRVTGDAALANDVLEAASALATL